MRFDRATDAFSGHTLASKSPVPCFVAKPGAAMINNKLVKRFDELISQANDLDSSKVYRHDAMIKGNYVNSEIFTSWKAKSRTLLVLACSDKSEHYKAFNENAKSNYTTNGDILLKLKAIMDGAKEDYVGGYCNSARSMIQAEVFDSELEQATELLSNGYYPAAAVIAGVVLETTIRQMCDEESVAHGKLDKMNSDLVKAGRYNLLVQKQVTALADLRNKAAHGHNEQFTKTDVESMIVEVRRFVAERT